MNTKTETHIDLIQFDVHLIGELIQEHIDPVTELTRYEYSITIITQIGKHVVPFYSSHQDYLDKKEKIDEELLKWAFKQTLQDALYSELELEEFCDRLGFDPEKEEDVQIYKDCNGVFVCLHKIGFETYDELETAIRDLEKLKI
jgi:hypothetical protein|tara:strand:- start:10323 stop:10754 length:432 start_codon:yes stop_codon:yes gene_type:complete